MSVHPFRYTYSTTRAQAGAQQVCDVCGEGADHEDHDLASELTRLRRWKAEAIIVIGRWEAVHTALGSPAELGQLRSAAAAAEAERLKVREERDAEVIAQLRAALTEAIIDLERAGMRPAEWTIADELNRTVRLGLAPVVQG